MNTFDRERLQKKYIEMICSKAISLTNIDNEILRNDTLCEISFLYGKYFEETELAFTGNEGLDCLNRFLHYLTIIRPDCNYPPKDIEQYIKNAMWECERRL